MRWLLLLVVGFSFIVGSVANAAPGTSLKVTAPADGAEIRGKDVTVSFQVSDGFKLVRSSVPFADAGKRPELNRPNEGHLHLMLDLQPVVVVASAEPYTFRNVAPGEHQLTVELTNNDHAPFSPPVVQQIRFRTVAAETLPDTGMEATLTSVLSRTLLILGALIVASGAFVLWRWYVATNSGPRPTAQ